MSVEYIKRLAGPFIGDGSGQKVFTFGFLVFDEGDVYVSVAEAENTNPRRLTRGEDFSVQMNEDQSATPGGSITLLTGGLAKGAVLAIGSAVPYTQTLTLTNFTRFPPERITKELDRIVVQIQQLFDEISRAITTDATDTITPQELKKKLLDAANDAFIVASQKAAEAAESAAAASASASEAAAVASEIPALKDAAISEIKSEAAAEGDHQIERIRAEGDNELIAAGMGCGEVTWTLQDEVAAGTEITIPSGLKYLVGRKHLRVAWNCLTLFRGRQFEEVGQEDTFSTTIKLTFDAQAGDELNAWVGALGKGEIAEAVNLANQALDSVATLSQKVVYKNEQAAE